MRFAYHLAERDQIVLLSCHAQNATAGIAARATCWSRHEIPEHERKSVIWILPRGLITAVLAIQVVESLGKEFAFLPAMAFAVILVTNAIVTVGSVILGPKLRTESSA